MNIFITWSGQLSKEIGEVFRKWLPGVLQVVRPYFTPDDMEKGTRWNLEIAKELEESGIGIMLLTRENLGSLWVMFEAGALSKQVERSRICPILFGIENTDLQGPLVQFQATAFNREDIYKLIQTINSACGEQKLEDSVLDGVFNMWWPKLESEVASILDKYKVTKEKLRNDRELLEEILSLSRAAVNGAVRISEPPFSPMILDEIMTRYERVVYALEAGDIERCHQELRRMERPLQYISSRLGIRTPHIQRIEPRRGPPTIEPAEE